MLASSSESRRWRRTPVLVATGLLALAALLAPSAARAEDDDPSVQQTIDANQQIVRGRHVIETGHVDMGPKFDGAQWKFLIHDDAHKADPNATSAWRYPDETALRVVDVAKLPVPDNQSYSFVGADPGAPVWVIPQTQNPDVVWAGWNTQDPTVMQKLDRGATFSVLGVQGPGVLTVYLQSGDFGAPQVLWDSRKSGAQSVWVETNTHTHANWVFTKPGVYLVQMRASATLIDGTKVSDTELVRFAVGTATPTDEAFAATWKGAAPTDTAATPGGLDSSAGAAVSTATTPIASEQGRDPLVSILIAAIVVVAAAMIIGFGIAIARGNRARRRVLAGRATAGGAPTQPTDGGSR